MRRYVFRFLWCSLLCVLLVTGAFAHVPVTTGDNEALETAIYVHDPLKSWAFYGQLREGGEAANYVRFDMEPGQRLQVSLFTPDENNFTPGLVLMGPGIESRGTVPAFVTVPEGSGALVIEGIRPEKASYEPFTPSSLYERADSSVNVTAAGTYYVAVYEPTEGGRYGLALGYREEFGVYEWIRVPVDAIRIHHWEGQSYGLILAPLLAVLVIGLGVLLRLKKRGAFVLQSPFGWLGSFSGLLYLGSGATILIQMALALTRAPLTSLVLVTLIFALLPIIAGIALLRVAQQARERVAWQNRLKMAVLGIAGLLFWAGLVLGPVFALIASILPPFSK
jgi:uncharacterized protein YhhL (DUF1145 family)